MIRVSRSLRAPCQPRDSEGISTHSESAEERREEFIQRLVKHEPHIRAFILSLVPNWAEADEVFQDTCVRLYQKIEQWDPSRDFCGWARTVAYYEVLSFRKSARVHRERFGQAFIEAVLRAYDHPPQDESRRDDAIKSCLGKLDAAHRRLLDLRYRDDLTVEQVAERSHRSVVATQKALTRIRKKLRDCVVQTLRFLEAE